MSTQDWTDVFSHTSISDCVFAFTVKVNSTVNRVLKEFSDELYPTTDLFNPSFEVGLFSESWKQSFISPIPKTRPVQSENDLRHVSLTPTLSKIQDFAVKWLYEDIGKKIDLRQFGSIKRSSTSLCLVDLLHNWLAVNLLTRPVITYMDASLTLVRLLITLITLFWCRSYYFLDM